ncbi:MAG TPA: MG2 domain-containing protein [Gemmatimonadaceae bacterium]|nr:MG2 domain-containing protein [Gemmatimonadaceae bacterium]
MSPARTLLAAIVALAPLAGPGSSLGVLRVSPNVDAAPLAPITITFDRPVAGSLDRSVDPHAIVRIEPAAEGTLEWRDPVTIRFTPTRRLQPDTRYTVTVRNDFQAMDGTRLAQPYSYSFRVHGPLLVTGSPASERASAQHLERLPTFELVWSDRIDPARLAAAAYVDIPATCAARRLIRLRVLGERALTKDDPWQYRYSGKREDGSPDSLRRVVTVQPVDSLPYDCAAALVLPNELDANLSQGLVRWDVRTYGPFRIESVRPCYTARFCPTGPLVVAFSTPVSGAEVQRRLHLLPATAFTVRDTVDVRDTWVLEARLVPRRTYVVVADTTMRDAFGQRFAGNPAVGSRTTGYEPSVDYPFGRLLVERRGFGTLAVQHVNVDTLVVTVAPVPDSLEGTFLRQSPWSWSDLWKTLAPGAVTRRVGVRSPRDTAMVTGVRVAGFARPGAPPTTLYAVRVESAAPRDTSSPPSNIALVQVTDLGVHARIGTESGMVWVTGASDGAARAGAQVTLYDLRGRAVAHARTDAQGLATLTGYHTGEVGAQSGEFDADDWEARAFDGHVAVRLGDDRALVGISQYDPDLSPWRFGVSAAWGGERIPAAAAVFTERGIYRPGEVVHAKAIVRAGALGALRVPTGDSLRWHFYDRESGTLADSVAPLSAFGTADHALSIPSDAPLGTYSVAVESHRGTQWVELARTTYRVAEYRPPEFLVSAHADSDARFPGDSMHTVVEARYLFGAPMGRAQLTWQVIQNPMSPWELEIPNTDGYTIGENGWWWEEDDESSSVIAGGVDTLDARGTRTVSVALPEPPRGRPARITLQAAVQDVNRQTVGSGASTVVHPSAFYVGVKPQGESYFWRAGAAQRLDVIAVRPTGARESGVRVHGTVVRREWHQVRRIRNGISEIVGEWVADTLGGCDVVTSASPATCTVTPAMGGLYQLTFRATDDRGRAVTTTLVRWVAGREWVPWNDESRFKMDVIADRQRYAVGDTATVMFASPFTDAEAWITVEREGVIEQRRVRLTSGSTTLRFPITEAFVPNAYVSIIVARGRSAPPGALDDPGRPTIRVGYAELRVTPEVKRLAVKVTPAASEYRPGDTARIALDVHDAGGHARRAEVTLWAVDEGVLALTGYRTPDPLDLLYRERGLGMRLASNMVSVAPQIPEGEKGRREPGGGGGAGEADVLRSRFQTTAFFLGSVVTDSAGHAVARAKLPDNLTTFRVMAVAVTAGDRYGSGESSLLVTRPLVARPALPRFVRTGDRFTAGTVINRRAGGTPTVQVTASATGLDIAGDAKRSARLEEGRGAEVRFGFRAPRGDSVRVRFDVRGAGDADAVQLTLPVRPDSRPRTYTVSGIVRDTATAELVLPEGIDPARSRLTLSLGASPMAVIAGLRSWLHVYPYQCSEQVASAGRAMAVLLAARAAGEGALDSARRAAATRSVRTAVATLERRQRTDGGIGYWNAEGWTSPWVSAYAGQLLLDARAAGVSVDDSVLARLAAYLSRSLHDTTLAYAPVRWWYDHTSVRLAEQVEAAGWLSRYGQPDIAAENQLLFRVAQLAWEDRAALAEMLARRGAMREARALLAPMWASVRVEGRRAVLPDSARSPFYFPSHERPASRLLVATMMADPGNALIGPLVETLVGATRANPWSLNTQDAASVVTALAAYDRRQRAAAAAGVRVLGGERVLLASSGTDGVREGSVSLTGLLRPGANGTSVLRVRVEGGGTEGAFYYLSVDELPRDPAVRPDQEGIQVERWYERYTDGAPIVSAVEGELVRVRLRVTAPADRQFVVLDDALPAGLEAVDLSLRTSTALTGPGVATQISPSDESDSSLPAWGWFYGSWDGGWWSPFEHRDMRDDRVVYFATVLWKGTYMVSYIARATTPGVFLRPPAHAEEMYNPAVHGRSDGGVFTVIEKGAER